MKRISIIAISLISCNLLIAGLIGYRASAQQSASAPSQLMSSGKVLLSPTGALTTFQNFSEAEVGIQAGNEAYISFEENKRHQLLITLDTSSAKTLHYLDGEIVQLEHDAISTSRLAGENIIYTAYEEGSPISPLFLYSSADQSTTKLSSPTQEIISLAYLDSARKILWAQETETGADIIECSQDLCTPNQVFSVPFSPKKLYTSDKSILAVGEKAYSFCQQPCEQAEYRKRSGEIIKPAFRAPFLSWSERQEGIAELMMLDLNTPDKIIQVTSASSGDQINPSISSTAENIWYISWENYSSEQDITSLASFQDQRLISQLNIPSPGRYPVFRPSSPCLEESELMSWNNSGKQWRTSPASTTTTEWISDFITLDTLSYQSTLSLEGSLNPALIKASWRTSENFSWKPATRSSSSPLSYSLDSAHKQFQIRFVLEGEQCLSSISFEHNNSAPSLQDNPNGSAFSPSEYERSLPLSLGETLSTEEIDLDDDVYASLNELLDTKEVNKALNKGPDRDRDGLSDSYEAVLKTDPNNPDTDQGGLSDGTEHLVHKLDPLDPSDDNDLTVRVSNIQPRSTIPVLDIITGFAPQIDKSVWFYLLDDRKKSIELGFTQPKPDGSFLFRAPPVPENYKGEVVLISTQVPDIRLAPLFPKLTQSLSIYLYNEEDILAKRKIIELALEIESLQFSQHGIPLKTLQADYREVYYTDESSPIDISITGRIYGENLSSVNVFSTLLPTLQEKNHEKHSEDGSIFDIQLHMDPYPQDIPIDISIQANDNEKNMSTTQTLSFNTRPLEKYPNTLSDIFSYLSQQQEVIALLILLLLLVSFYIMCLKTDRDISGNMTFILITLCILAILYSITSSSLYILHKNGILEGYRQQQEIQKRREIVPSALTLLKRDQNLNVVPQLAKSWSNVDDLIWEFRLRKHVRRKDQSFIKSEDIIRTLQEKIAQHSPEQQYLASINQIIHINDQIFQIITHFPDPLLPQKLTKVTLLSSETPDDDNLNGLLYIPLEISADHKRSKINPWFFDYPFANNGSTYINESYSLNPQSFLKRIQNQELDLIDEPAQELWPDLKENNYLIVPKVSTESFILLTNRNSFFLENPNTIKQLQSLLHHESLLEAFPNESTLSQQFVPPGVIGYNSELRDREIKTLPSSEETLTLKLNYPVKESRLAELIETRLQASNINIIPVEYSSTEFKQALLSNLPDLILLPLNFELADAGPFLDAFIDSNSPFNTYYSNEKVDELILQSRFELDQYKRLQILKEIMSIIVDEDPAGIPLINRKKFQAIKQAPATSLWDRWVQRVIRSHAEKENPLEYINPYREEGA